MRRAPGRPPTRQPQLLRQLKPLGQTLRHCQLPRSRLQLSRSAGYVTWSILNRMGACEPSDSFLGCLLPIAQAMHDEPRT